MERSGPQRRGACGSAGRRRRGFTLVELLVVIAVIAVLVGILLPALAASRKAARQGLCASNMATHGKAVAAYAADYKDRFATYSWRREIPYPLHNSSRVYGPFTTDLPAARWQVTDLVKRYAAIGDQVDEIAPLPYVEYGTLFLAEYLAQRAPDPVGICPEDRDQLRWSGAPADTRAMFPGDPYRWVRSSYWVSLPFVAGTDRETPASMLRQVGVRQFDVLPQTTFGDRRMSEVAFASSKVMFYERSDRHAGRSDTPLFFTHPGAKVNTLTSDGSVRQIASAESNPGGYIQAGGTVARVPLVYAPSAGEGEAPWPSGTPATQPPRFAATVWGLKGIDLGGREVTP